MLVFFNFGGSVGRIIYNFIGKRLCQMSAKVTNYVTDPSLLMLYQLPLCRRLHNNSVLLMIKLDESTQNYF